MASNLGSVFVELSLDDKVFKQKLSETLKSTEATAKGIETSWKVLSAKSDQYFHNQRMTAENAYKLIKSSATSTSAEILRAEEAKNAKIKALDEQQFGRQTGFIEKWKKNWLAATAAVTAAYFALSKAWDLAEKAANFEQQKVGFANLAASYGSNGENILESLKKVSGGTVDSMTLVNKAGTAMMMGIDPDKIVKLMEIARATTRVTGQSVTQAFDDISLAVARSSKLKLDNLGIIIDVAKANEEYALELGTTAEKLNDTQRKQAFLNASIKAGDELIKRMGEQTDTTRDKMDRLKVTLEELQLLMGQGLIRAGLGLYGVFQMVAAAALKISQGIFKIAQGANTLLDLVTFDNSLGGAAAKRDAAYWATQADAAGGAAADLFGKSKENFAAMIAPAKDFATAMAKTVVSPSSATTTGKGGGGADNSLSNIAKDTYEDAINAAEHAAKMEILAGKDVLQAKLDALTKQQAALETYYVTEKALAGGNKEKLSAIEADYNEDFRKYSIQRTEIIKQQELNALELKKAAAENQSELDKKSIELAKALYDAKSEYGVTTPLEDLRTEYEAKRKNLDLDMKKLDAELLYAEAKKNDVNREKEILEIKKKQRLLQMEISGLKDIEDVEAKKYTGTFFEGWSTGILKWKNETKSEFENAQDMAEETAKAMKTSLSDGFYKLIKGESVTIADVFGSIFDSILKKFTDMCAEMVVKWMISIADMEAIKTGASAVASGIGAIIGGLFHGGGIVGENTTGVMMPAYAFAGAPRLHNGLSADEYPAILQKGEEVIPKSKAGQKQEKSGDSANLNQYTININAVDAKSFAELCKRNPSALIGPVMSGMKSNKTRNDMRKLLK